MPKQPEQLIAPLTTHFKVNKGEVVLGMGRIDSDITKVVQERLYKHNSENPYFAVDTKKLDDAFLIIIKNDDPVLLAKSAAMVMSYRLVKPINEDIARYNQHDKLVGVTNYNRNLKFAFAPPPLIPEILSNIKQKTDNMQAKLQIDGIARNYQQQSR
jgi:hypothetical protein